MRPRLVVVVPGFLNGQTSPTPMGMLMRGRRLKCEYMSKVDYEYGIAGHTKM